MEPRYQIYALILALTWILPTPADGSSLASWWLNYDPDLAPAVAKYDNNTGKIYYSLCNSIKTPVFAYNESTTLDLDARYPPISGSSIAGVGYAYTDGDNNPDIIQSPIFYLTDLEGVGPTIVEALFTCNRTTGLWYQLDPDAFSWPLSNGTYTTDDKNIPIPDIDPESGLAALYIGTTGGHRIYFKSTNGTTHYIKYKSLPGPENGWNYGGMISSNFSLLPGKEIAAAFASDESDPDPDTLELHVAYGVPANASASDDVNGEIEWAVSGIDGQEAIWEINRIPTTLLATSLGSTNQTNTTEVLNNMTSSDYSISFGSDSNVTLYNYSGSSSHIGMSIDAKANPSIWYIGSDALPHQYAGDANENWTQSTSQDETKWPLADNANSELAVTSDADDDKFWLFYVVDGNITMLVSTSGQWNDAAALIPFNSTTEAATMASNGSSSSSSGLSESAKIGIGVGVGVGVPLIAAALTLFVCFRRKRSRQARAQQTRPETTTTSSTVVSPTAPWSSISGTPQYKPALEGGQAGYWIGGMWVPADHPSISPYTAENKPVGTQMGMAQRGAVNAYTGLPMVESDSAQVYEMAHDEHAQEMPDTTSTAVPAYRNEQAEGLAGDGLTVSVGERPRGGRMVEQL